MVSETLHPPVVGQLATHSNPHPSTGLCWPQSPCIPGSMSIPASITAIGRVVTEPVALSVAFRAPLCAPSAGLCMPTSPPPRATHDHPLSASTSWPKERASARAVKRMVSRMEWERDRRPLVGCRMVPGGSRFCAGQSLRVSRAPKSRVYRSGRVGHTLTAADRAFTEPVRSTKSPSAETLRSPWTDPASSARPAP
jgi:hypothetical protein